MRCQQLLFCGKGAVSWKDALQRCVRPEGNVSVFSVWIVLSCLSYHVSRCFFLEILLAVFDLLAIRRILSLYAKENTAFWLAPLSLAVVFSSYSFYWGGSAEEICFPFLLWGLFLLLRYFKEDYPSKPVSFKTLFAAGILAGMVANIKFTGLGFSLPI